MLKAINQLTEEEIQTSIKLKHQCLELAKQQGNFRDFFKMLIMANCIRVQLVAEDKFRFNPNAGLKDSFQFNLTHIDIEQTIKFIEQQTVQQSSSATSNVGMF